MSKYFLTGALKDLLGILSVYDQNVTGELSFIADVLTIHSFIYLIIDYKNPISNANQIKLSTVSAALSILFDSSGTKEAR